MASLGKLQKYSLIAIIVIFIAFILIVVGVATDGWAFFNNIDIKYALSEFELFTQDNRSKGQAAYALCVISTLGAATALTSISIDVLLQLIDKKNETLTKILPLVTLIAAIVGGVFGIIGSIIHVAWFADLYGSSSKFSPGYSFFLTIIGSIVLIVGGVLAKKAGKGGHIGGV